jgi:sugar lactone lactonase YvrE
MAEVLYRSSCELGESPVWHPERRSCFWVDVEAKTIFEYNWDKRSVLQYQLDHRVSLIIPAEKNKLVLGLQGGAAKFDLITMQLTWLPSPDVNWEDFRCNDGGADVHGRLWISTMELNHQKDAGAIYCITGTGLITKKIDNVSIPNGIVFSADHKRMYYTDSVKAEIYACLYDAETAGIQFEKIAVKIPAELGLPDGMAMDEEGMLWIALWGGYGVGRFDLQAGQMVDFIDIPAPHVTACCFGGVKLDHMIITTARSGLSEEELQTYPESGNVFIVKTSVKGISIHYTDL